MDVPQYALDMSWVVISKPSGRQVRRSNVTVKVPHVVGKLCKLMNELIDRFEKAGDHVMGNERFCNIRYLSVCPSLGMMDMGEDWNGPMRASIVAFEAGLMCWPTCISFCMTFVK